MLLIKYTTTANVKQHVSGNKQNPNSEQIISIFNWISHPAEFICYQRGRLRKQRPPYCILLQMKKFSKAMVA